MNEKKKKNCLKKNTTANKHCLPRCAGGGRKDEWAVGGEINWAEDGLTGPVGKY